VKLTTSVYAKDAAAAKELAKRFKDGLDQAIAEGTKNPDKVPAEMKPVLEAMKGVKVGTADDAVTLEVSTPPDVMTAALKVLLTPRPASDKPGPDK
jgi:hypothetical protein